MKLFKTLCVALATIFFLAGCSSDSETSVQNRARVQLKLVDAPGDYEEVNVEIIDIVYNTSDDDSNWKSFASFSGPKMVDLTTLIAGNTMLLSDEVIEADAINEVRLILGNNNSLLLEGETSTRALNTPSAQQSGLKLKLNQELQAGFSYTFILDWDVQKSVVEAGNSGNYNLKPVIRVNAEKNSGSISGQVNSDNDTTTTNDDTPVANAVVSVYTLNNTLVAETFTNAEGRFTVQGLPAGVYIVKINKDDFAEFTSAANITVNIGKTANLGTVILISA